jgi:hypothetical protein
MLIDCKFDFVVLKGARMIDFDEKFLNIACWVELRFLSVKLKD